MFMVRSMEMRLCVTNRLTCIAGTCRPSTYKKRTDAAIPKPARTAAFTEVACVPEDCICALKVSSEKSFYFAGRESV